MSLSANSLSPSLPPPTPSLVVSRSSRVAVLVIAITLSLLCAAAIWGMKVQRIRADVGGPAPQAYTPIRDDDLGDAPSAVEMVEVVAGAKGSTALA